MTKKSRGPRGPSVLPRAAQEEEEKKKRRPAGQAGRFAGRKSDRPTRPAGAGAKRFDSRPRDERPGRPTGAKRSDSRPRGERPARSAGPGAKRFDSRPRKDSPGFASRRPREEGGRPRDDRKARPVGAKRFDSRPRDERPARPAGAKRFDSRPRGERPTRPAGPGAKRFDSRPRGERPTRPGGPGAKRFDSRPRDERPTRPAGPGAKRFDSRPRGERPARPAGPGAKRFDSRPRGERPTRPAGAGAKRFDSRPRKDSAGFGSRRPREERGKPHGAPTDRGRFERRPTGKPGAPRGVGQRPDSRSFHKRHGPKDRNDKSGRRFARPQRFDAVTGRPVGGVATLEPSLRTKDELRKAATQSREVSTAPAATRPRRSPNVRDLALQVLFQVDVKRAYAERVMEELAEHFRLDRRDRGFLNELVKGTLRRRATIDYHLDRLVHQGLTSLPVWIQNGLRLGAYQLIYLDRVPPRAAVDEAVKLALKYGHPGTAGLSNSVLRRLAEAVSMRELELPPVTKKDGSVDLDLLVAVTSHPRWLLERWIARYGVEETLALCEANNRTAALGLRANRLKLDREELLRRLQSAGLSGRPGALTSHIVWVDAETDFSDFPAYARGDCTVQDESETLVGHLLAPRPGERVLDLCAAPGGKASHLAELMGDQGEIVAVEKVAPRARTMQRGIERLGLKSITIEVRDGTEANLTGLGKGGPYDRVLVDAPCSGLGVLARRADARWRKEASRLVESAELQGRLLRAGAGALKPGGVLVYSVCSLEPEETDQVVASFLVAHPEWRIENAAAFVPAEVVEAGGAMRVLPHRHGTDGAYAVRLVKPEER